MDIATKELYEWCRIPADQLQRHPGLKIPFRLCPDSAGMGQLMAGELADLIESNNARKLPTRAIIPCGPSCWYEPWGREVVRRGVSLRNVSVFHMDECLDWQGRLLPAAHPCNFRTFMERHFYGAIPDSLNVPPRQRHWLEPRTVDSVGAAIESSPIDITYGGWGQDGHIAYNQARRHPYSQVSIEELRNSSIRIQDNNIDTILALAQRTFGAAWQFVPPMSVTLGVKECLAARKVRLFSDTGAWKATALRVALFGPLTAQYPMTLLQGHPDAMLTATLDTASHPVSLNPQWDLGLGG